MAAVVDDHGTLNVSSNTWNTNSVTAPASGILFLWIYTILAATPVPHVTSVTGLSGTWTEIAHVDSANNTKGITVGYLTGCTGSGALTINIDQTVSSNQAWAVLHWTNINTVTPYISSNTQSATAVSTSQTVTPNALANASNDYVVGITHPTAEDVTPSNGSATELFDDNAANNRGLEMNDLPGWTSGAMGGSWTTSGLALLMGIEVNDSGTPASGDPLSPLFHTITGGYR